MTDALTVSEVAALARRLRGELTQIPLPVNVAPALSYAIGRAQATVDELLLLCEFVEDQHAGLVVLIDPDEPRAG